MAALLLDLDGSKEINETYGPQTGDEVLAILAAILRRTVLSRDIVARLDGDEFVVVLIRIERVSDAITVADRILQDLREPHVIVGVDIAVRTRIGVAVADQPTNAPAILYRADQAMHEVK